MKILQMKIPNIIAGIFGTLACLSITTLVLSLICLFLDSHEMEWDIFAKDKSCVILNIDTFSGGVAYKCIDGYRIKYQYIVREPL